MSDTECAVLIGKVYDIEKVAAEIRKRLRMLQVDAPAVDTSATEQRRYGIVHAQLFSALHEISQVLDTLK